MDFPLHMLHANRHPVERRSLLPMIHAMQSASKLGQDKGIDEKRHYEEHLKPLEDVIIAAFPKGMSDREIFEIVLREQYWEDTITQWRSAGSAIFSFAPDLVAMLERTDVWDMPVQAIRLPYDRLYVSLPGGFLPAFDDEFEIDGFYLTAEKFLPDRLKSDFTSDEAILQEAQTNHRRIGETGMARFYEIYGVNSFDAYVTELLKRNALARESCARFESDPDEWYRTIGAATWSDYWDLSVDFTFRSKTRRLGPWATEYIAREPILRAAYDFANHRSTVRDALADGQACGFPTETFFEEDKRANDLRNVVSAPEHLEAVTRLVFNIVCYLNWPERDEKKRLSDSSAQARVEAAPPGTNKRRKEQSRAIKEGLRVISFCGYSQAPAQPGQTTDKQIASHWRRGHWRNQRYGKRFSESKLMWIFPVLVKAAHDTGDVVTTVYKT